MQEVGAGRRNRRRPCRSGGHQRTKTNIGEGEIRFGFNDVNRSGLNDSHFLAAAGPNRMFHGENHNTASPHPLPGNRPRSNVNDDVLAVAAAGRAGYLGMAPRKRRHAAGRGSAATRKTDTTRMAANMHGKPERRNNQGRHHARNTMIRITIHIQ